MAKKVKYNSVTVLTLIAFGLIYHLEDIDDDDDEITRVYYVSKDVVLKSEYDFTIGCIFEFITPKGKVRGVQIIDENDDENVIVAKSKFKVRAFKEISLK